MRAVICANGSLDHPEWASAALQPDDLLIAADGGARHYQELGLAPSVVIGDMDSLPAWQEAELRQQGARLISHPSEKDQTDLELALSYAIQQGVDEILLLGLLGGRLDQTIANLLLLARQEWHPASLMVIDGPDIARLLRQGEEVEVEGQVGEVVSLIPLSPTVTGVTTRGLRWALDGASLEFGSTLGISNEMTSTSAFVQIEQGSLLVVQRRSDQ